MVQMKCIQVYSAVRDCMGALVRQALTWPKSHAFPRLWAFKLMVRKIKILKSTTEYGIYNEKHHLMSK